MARKSKKLLEEKGILSLPDPVCGPSLLATRNSWHCMEGFCICEKGRQASAHSKVTTSEQLERGVLWVQGEISRSKIGFSKFADLRPKHCILAGASGTHSVCVCTIHQNVKLLMMEMQLPELPTYHHCLAKIMCNPRHPTCYLGECDACPGIEKLKEELLTQLDENDVDQIIYKQWVSINRSTLETYLSQAEEFADYFCDKLELLRPHSFIAKEQASFYATRKTTLKAGEFLVTADFSENHSFVLQDSAQGFHWNNSQATLHLFVAYYLDLEEVRHFSYVVIADCLHHDMVAVHLFQKALLIFWIIFCLQRCTPQKIIYFSDGAASQYKNWKKFPQFVSPQRWFWSCGWMAFFSHFARKGSLWWSWWNSQMTSSLS